MNNDDNMAAGLHLLAPAHYEMRALYWAHTSHAYAHVHAAHLLSRGL